MFMMYNNENQFEKCFNPDLNKNSKSKNNWIKEDLSINFSSNHKDKQKVFILDTYNFDDGMPDNSAQFATFRAATTNKNRPIHPSNIERNNEWKRNEMEKSHIDSSYENNLIQVDKDFSKQIFCDDYIENTLGQTKLNQNQEDNRRRKIIGSIKSNKIKKSQSTSKNVFKWNNIKPQVNKIDEKNFDSRSSSIHLIMKQDQL